MSISVIIPTYNGVHKVVGLLRSIEQQTQMPDEVIVVIDGSTDGTAAILRTQTFKLPLRIIEQNNGGRAQVRNKGAEEAKGDLLLFIDDDMIVNPDWVKEHRIHHQRIVNSIATGMLKDPFENKGNDFQQFKSWLNNKWNKNIVRSNEASVLLSTPYLTAGNASIPRAIFNQLQGFNEKLNDAEDYDMAKRACLLNIPLYMNFRAFAWHNENVNCTQYIKRLRQYAIAQKKLEALDPVLYGGDHQYKIAAPQGIKGFIFKTLAAKWWINSVDKQTWVWLPQSIRYKLYDMIVTANGSFFPERVAI